MDRNRFFITGAGSGIGRALAELVVENGHAAVLADIDEASVRSAAAKLGQSAVPVGLDIRDAKGWNDAFDLAWQRLGGLDVLVNNAAVFDADWARDQAEDAMREVMDTDLFGLINGTRLGLQRLEEQGHGHIINIGSIAGFTPLPGQAFYAAVKHAVRAWHHGFAIENRESPVSFTLVCPGAVDTPMIRAYYGRDAAALAFAGPLLTARQVAEVIYRSARRKPREVSIPRAGGALMRLLGVYPGLIRVIVPGMMRRGIKAMGKGQGKS